MKTLSLSAFGTDFSDLELPADLMSDPLHQLIAQEERRIERGLEKLYGPTGSEDAANLKAQQAARAQVVAPVGAPAWDRGVASRGGAALTEDAVQWINGWKNPAGDDGKPRRPVFDTFAELVDHGDLFICVRAAEAVTRTAVAWKLGLLKDYSDWDVQVEQQYGEILEALFTVITARNASIQRMRSKYKAEEYDREPLYPSVYFGADDERPAGDAEHMFRLFEELVTQKQAQREERRKAKEQPATPKCGFNF